MVYFTEKLKYEYFHILFGDKMKIPLVYDEKNHKYRLLDSIFKIIDSDETKKELARNGIKPINQYIKTIKTRFISMFFDINIKYVVNEINNSPKLREKWNIKSILDYNKFSNLMSSVDSSQILEFVLKLINKQFPKPKRGRRTILMDATPMKMDINLDKKFYGAEELERKGFEIGFSKTHGYFIGGKLTVAIDFHTGQPLAILMHKGGYSDAKIFKEMIEELTRRRIMSKKDIIMADKGYVSYENYEIGVMNYNIIPLIFPKENMRLDKIFGRCNYPLEIYKGNVKLKKLLEDVTSTFKIFMKHWKLFKPIRACIEHFFKLMKNGVGYSIYHMYTYESVEKNAILNVLLAGLTISEVSFDLKKIQILSEM
jgi:hypothetical protein